MKDASQETEAVQDPSETKKSLNMSPNPIIHEPSNTKVPSNPAAVLIEEEHLSENAPNDKTPEQADHIVDACDKTENLNSEDEPVCNEDPESSQTTPKTCDNIPLPESLKEFSEIAKESDTPEPDEESDNEDLPLELSPDHRYTKTNRKVTFREVPGLDSAFVAFDAERGTETVWNEIFFTDRRTFRDKESDIKEMFDNLVKLNQPNLVKYYAWWTDAARDRSRPRLCFITELMTCGSLRSFLIKSRKPDNDKLKTETDKLKPRQMPVKSWRRWCKQLLAALRYLHEGKIPITHGNLNVDTVFMEHSGLLKIGSVAPLTLGLNKNNVRPRVRVRNAHFLAPEFASEAAKKEGTKTALDSAVDIYSFGMIALEMYVYGIVANEKLSNRNGAVLSQHSMSQNTGFRYDPDQYIPMVTAPLASGVGLQDQNDSQTWETSSINSYTSDTTGMRSPTINSYMRSELFKFKKDRLDVNERLSQKIAMATSNVKTSLFIDSLNIDNMSTPTALDANSHNSFGKRLVNLSVDNLSHSPTSTCDSYRTSHIGQGLISRKLIDEVIEKIECEEIRNFIKLCLNPDPWKRPTARDLLFHPVIFTVPTLRLLASNQLVNLQDGDLTAWNEDTSSLLDKMDRKRVFATSSHKGEVKEWKYSMLKEDLHEVTRYINDVRNGVYPVTCFKIHKSENNDLVDGEEEANPVQVLLSHLSDIVSQPECEVRKAESIRAEVRQSPDHAHVWLVLKIRFLNDTLSRELNCEVTEYDKAACLAYELKFHGFINECDEELLTDAIRNAVEVVDFAKISETKEDLKRNEEINGVVPSIEWYRSYERSINPKDNETDEGNETGSAATEDDGGSVHTDGSNSVKGGSSSGKDNLRTLPVPTKPPNGKLMEPPGEIQDITYADDRVSIVSTSPLVQRPNTPLEPFLNRSLLAGSISTPPPQDLVELDEKLKTVISDANQTRSYKREFSTPRFDIKPGSVFRPSYTQRSKYFEPKNKRNPSQCHSQSAVWESSSDGKFSNRKNGDKVERSYKSSVGPKRYPKASDETRALKRTLEEQVAALGTKITLPLFDEPSSSDGEFNPFSHSSFSSSCLDSHNKSFAEYQTPDWSSKAFIEQLDTFEKLYHEQRKRSSLSASEAFPLFHTPQLETTPEGTPVKSRSMNSPVQGEAKSNLKTPSPIRK